MEAFLQQHNGDISLLVVTNLDRIGRKFFLVQDKLQELITKYTVEVATTKEVTSSESKLFEELKTLQTKYCI